MAGNIPSSFISEILERVDIIDVIGRSVNLRKTGKNHSGLCPFHNENTPSFTVNQQKQFYYCFGCGASGDALKFIMEHNGLDFVAAVEHLSAMAGLQVPKQEQSQAQRQQQSLRQQLYALMQQACELFQQQLWQHPERHIAIDYLKKRGLSAQVARQFQLGYAPNQWDNLIYQLSPTTEQLQQFKQLGLIVDNQEKGRTYDFFRQRVIFPIRDRRGKVIAFGGRVLDNSKTAKYLNSPESPIFHKGQELYGLYEAKQNSDLSRILVVEGYMDVIALAQEGIHYGVATLGTATSSQQIERLQALSNELYFCFDGDKAGRNAAWRALENALPVLKDGIRIRFSFLPEGDDPDSFVRKHGKQAFEQTLMQGPSLSDFLLSEMQDKHQIDSLEGKADFAKSCIELISQLRAPLLKSLLLQQISSISNLDSQQLTALLNQQPAPTTTTPSPQPGQTKTEPKPSLQPREQSNTQGLQQADLQLRLCCLLLRAPELASLLPSLGPEFQAQSLQQLWLKEQPGNQFLAADLLKQQQPQLFASLSQSHYFVLIQSLTTDELIIQGQQLIKRLHWQLPNAELEDLELRLKQGANLSKEEYKRYTELTKLRKRQGLGRC